MLRLDTRDFLVPLLYMSSIKQISLKGTIYNFPSDDDSSKSIKVTVEKQTFQTITVDVIKPTQINSDDDQGETNIKTIQLSIAVTSDPEFKPGTILIDGVDTGKTVYTLQATKDIIISANNPTASENSH